MGRVLDLIQETITSGYDMFVKEASFDMHQIIKSCNWINNQGVSFDCMDAIQPRLFVKSGTCFAINNIAGKHRLSGNAMTSQLEVTLVPLPMPVHVLDGLISLPNDYQYKAFLTIPGDDLPDNPNEFYPIKQGDIHIFEVDNYKTISLLSKKNAPCRTGHLITGKPYQRPNCISECYRLLVREKLGCWLYDTDPQLIAIADDQDRFEQSDAELKQNSEFALSEIGQSCDEEDISRALGLRRNLANCTLNCPLACQYESFTVDHIISKTQLEPLALTHEVMNATTLIKLKQKRTTIERMRQFESYTWLNFIAEVGGSMGLCIGASILTLCHLFEFVFFDLAAKIYRSITTNRQQAAQSGGVKIQDSRLNQTDQGTSGLESDACSQSSGAEDWKGVETVMCLHSGEGSITSAETGPAFTCLGTEKDQPEQQLPKAQAHKGGFENALQENTAAPPVVKDIYI